MGQSGIAGQTQPRVTPQTSSVASNLGIASQVDEAYSLETSWHIMLIENPFMKELLDHYCGVLNFLFHPFFALS